MRKVFPLVVAGIVVLAACDQYPTGTSDAPLVPEAAALNLLDGLSSTGEFVEGQVLVRFRPGAARNEIAQANRARPKEETLLSRLWILEVDAGEELEIATNLAKNPNVEFAEPNYIYSVIPCETGDCTAPSDPAFGQKWDLHNNGFITDAGGNVLAETGTSGADIAWLEAFEYLQSSETATQSTVIGVIDTGIRPTHQDLAGKVIGGRNYCPSLFCLIGGVNPDQWADDQGHGTHVAGIAAAHGNNALGVPGVGYVEDVQLLAVKVCGGPLGLCNAAGITNGIVWAVDNGAHVLNLSLGGPTPSAATQTSLAYAVQNNVLPVCASGNDGAGVVSWPAAFPECMAVGSTNWSDGRATYSNWGPEIEVSAPGGDIEDSVTGLSFILAPYHTANNAYARMAGTSMAAPQVAGLAALLRATGITDAAEIRARIRDTADDLGPAGWDPEFGDGRINVYRALTQMDPFIAMEISVRGTVRLGAGGNLQVVLFARDAETFDLGMIELETLRIGSTQLATRPNGTLFANWSDVDGDGQEDLVLHFSIPELRDNHDLTAATSQITLRGDLDDGREMRGSGSIRVLN